MTHPEIDLPPRQMDPRRYEAIHRALLTGLLGNVGAAGDDHEYTGARGKKFFIFPGSGQFRKQPPWIVAGEMAETTRLYARTVARIKPHWIEEAAQHLVQRSYFEPHWQRHLAQVVAFEKVTLYGLVLDARRRVHYGPIDPKISREMFIQNALVHTDYKTDAPWFRHNRSLVRELELLEAKLRRRDILVDPQSRFDFYNARIPPDVYSGRLFEAWRGRAERRDRRILFMRREDLVAPGPTAPLELFPDHLLVDGIRIPLSYRFEPGHPADGITATLPLGALNQVKPEPFEWLVPGWLEEKIAGLIKTLARELRIHLIPAPDKAKAAAATMTFAQGPLLPALSWELGRITGVNVPHEVWRPQSLPDHLLMNFKVVDEAGKPIAAGRDLAELRVRLSADLKQTLANVPESPWHRDGITRWDFGDLPEKVQLERPGITLRGYPALVDREDSVSLRLMESPESAQRATRGGVRRLFALQLAHEIKYLSRSIRRIDEMCLHYATLGTCDELKRDLVSLIIDRALFGDIDDPVRTREQFADRAEAAWRNLGAESVRVSTLVGQILKAYHDLSVQLSKTFPPLLSPAIVDMRQHLGSLIQKGFVGQTPFQWLSQFPRFLRGIELRLQKLLDAGASRDAQAAAEIDLPWRAYQQKNQLLPADAPQREQLELYRWMIEELRISLFAQELKTSIPISRKRLSAQWSRIQG